MFDLDAFLRNSGFDRYDRNARLYPAFLSLLPLFVVVALWFPPAWTLLGGLLSLVAGLGAIYLLGQVVRYQGRKLETKLGTRVGRAKTARLLSHSDPDIPAGTKARYHAYLSQHGVHVPAIDHEQADPAAAHGAFLSAVDWLLVHLRPKAKASGLLNENIAYGFRRNLLGVKPAAMAILFIAMAVDAGLLWRGGEPNQAVAGGVIELLMAGCLLGWLFIVRADFVEDASAAYAKRFLEQCEPKRTVRKPAQREVVP